MFSSLCEDERTPLLLSRHSCHISDRDVSKDPEMTSPRSDTDRLMDPSTRNEYFNMTKNIFMNLTKYISTSTNSI